MEKQTSLPSRLRDWFVVGESIWSLIGVIGVVATVILPASGLAWVIARFGWVPNVLPAVLVLTALGVTLVYTISWLVGRELRGQVTGWPNARSGIERLTNAPAVDMSLAATNRDLRQKVGELRDEIVGMEQKYKTDEWWWRYGEYPPPVAALEKPDIADVRKEIRRLSKSVLNPLADALVGIRDDLLTPMYQTEAGTFARLFADIFRDEYCAPVLGLLGRVLNEKNDDDIRPAFVLFFKQYAELRLAMQAVAAWQNRDVTTLKGYAEWRDADARFYAKLDEVPAETRMWAIRELVSDWAKEQKGYPKALPAPPPALSASRTATLPSPRDAS